MIWLAALGALAVGMLVGGAIGYYFGRRDIVSVAARASASAIARAAESAAREQEGIKAKAAADIAAIPTKSVDDVLAKLEHPDEDRTPPAGTQVQP